MERTIPSNEFTLERIVSEAAYMAVVVRAPAEVWLAAIAVIEDFIDRADDHLVSYAGVREEEAREVVRLIRAALDDGRARVTMRSIRLRDMGALIEQYRSHGYGGLKGNRDAAVTEQEWERLCSSLEGAVETLNAAESEMPFTVYVGDNFHYDDQSYVYEMGKYPTEEMAIAACKQRVDEYLAHAFKPGMSADALFTSYRSFGEDPWVSCKTGVLFAFSAWTYAEKRSKELTASVNRSGSAEATDPRPGRCTGQ